MRSDVHFAALRAAAKVAFSVAFVSGCAAQTADAGDPATADGTEPATTAEADLSAKKTKKKTGQASSLPSECHHDAGVPKLSCDQVVAGAFPTAGLYPGAKQNVSAEVQTCCADLLAPSDGGVPMVGEHRWDCCANLSADAGQQLVIACTPWGPPVPPAMKRRARPIAASPSLQAVA
jgi:hypothetical protein